MYAKKHVVKFTFCGLDAEMQIKMSRLLCPAAPSIVAQSSI